MRQDVKDLADAMERGYRLVPKNCYAFFNDDLSLSHVPIDKINSACAMGHALIGRNESDVSRLGYLFPILDDQRVEDPRNRLFGTLLFCAINMLIHNYGWTTLQVIEWLRSHLND